MSTKRVPIGKRPLSHTDIDAWIQRGNNEKTSGSAKADVYTARLTIDVTPDLRSRIKIAAFQQHMTVAELLRVLLEREFDGSEIRQ